VTFISWLHRFFGFSLASLLAFQAVAQPQLLPAQSEIVFVSKQMGVPVEGRFKHLMHKFALTQPDRKSVV